MGFGSMSATQPRVLRLNIVWPCRRMRAFDLALQNPLESAGLLGKTKTLQWRCSQTKPVYA